MTGAEPGHCVYLVRCSDGSLYTGYARNVAARVAVHNAGRGAKYTRTRRPVTLAAWADLGDQHVALSAEWHVKRLSKEAKETLVVQYQASPDDFRRSVLALVGESG